MALFKQSSTAYRLNYLWYTKQEIANAINEVGKNKGISVNPRQDFAKFAEKILKLQTSVWSSANDSEDPHLTITENGYYKVSDLSLRQFGDASKKTVVSSFYVNVQSAPIIIGNKRAEYGHIANRGVKTPKYDFDESFTGNSLAEILTQFVNRLGIVMGAQVTKEGTVWTVTFDNGKVITISESGTINTPSGIMLGVVAYAGPIESITFRLIKNTKAIFFTTGDGYTYNSYRTFILATTDNNEDAAWVTLGDFDTPLNISNGHNVKTAYVMLNGNLLDQSNLMPLYWSSFRTEYTENKDTYIMYNIVYVKSGNNVCLVDFGENLFMGPDPGNYTSYVPQIPYPASYSLNNSEFAALMNNSCFWQRL